MRVQVKLNALKIDSEDSPRHLLTEDRAYFVIGINNESRRVISDDGEPILFPKHLFDMMNSSIPPNWQFIEDDDGAYHLDPRRTAAPGFYEDYFWSDGDTQAQLKAHQELHSVLEEAFEWGEEEDRLLIKRDMERLVAREKHALAHPGRRWP